MMKKFIYLLFIVIGFSSCMKEESFEIPLDIGNLSMKIDGVDWVADKAVDLEVGEGWLKIYGISNDDKELSFLLSNPKLGDFDIEQLGGNAIIFTDRLSMEDGFYTVYSADSLPEVEPAREDYTIKLKITEYNEQKGTISGTFEGILYNVILDKEIVITEGTFTKLKLPGGNDDDGGTPNDQSFPGSGKATWKLNNVGATGNVTWTAAQGGADLFLVSATTSDNKQIMMFTFMLKDNNPELMAMNLGYNMVDNLIAQSPTIKIESFNFASKKIKFTFSANLKSMLNDNSYNVTEGKLNLGY